MFVRLFPALLIVACTGGQLAAVEPFDAAAFVKSLRQPIEVEIADRELEKVPNRSTVHCMEFSDDGKTLCAVQINGIIATWDVASGKLQTVQRIRASKLRAKLAEGADMFVERYVLCEDRTRVGLALRGGDVVFWDVKKEEVVSVLDPELKGKCHGLALTSDGKFALLGGAQARGAVVVDTQTGKKAFVHDAAVTDILHVAISPNDRWALFAEKDKVHLYPLLGGEGITLTLEAPIAVSHFKGTDYGAFFVSSQNELMAAGLGIAQSYYLRVGVPAKMVLAAEPPYFIVYDKDARLEIRSFDSPGIGWYHNFASDKPIMFAIAPNGRTLALETKEGTKLKILSATPEHPSARATRAFRELLAAEKHHELKLLAQQLHKEQDEPFAWEPLDAPLEVLCDSLIGQTDILPRLEAWAAEDKDALLPKLLLGKKYIQTAWRYRGGGAARTVTKEGWKGFREYIGKARDLIVPLCENASAPGPARELLLTIAMAESWKEDDWMPHADWMRTNAPNYVRGHQQAVQMLLRRWGGKPGDSARYAARLADSIGGVDGDAMYAKVWLASYDLHGKSRSIVTELEMDLERVKRGLLHLSEKSANPAYFAHRGLQVSFNERDQAGAQAFLDKLKDPNESWEATWWTNALELARAIQYAKSAAGR